MQEAVHGVTLEECQAALQNHSWNVQKAMHYLKVRTSGRTPRAPPPGLQNIPKHLTKRPSNRKRVEVNFLSGANLPFINWSLQ